VHRAQIPIETLHSIPNGVHSRSETQASWQVPLAHRFPASQSAPLAQSTHRPIGLSQTCPDGQSSDVVQTVNATHPLGVQSCKGPQSAAVTHSTHAPSTRLHTTWLPGAFTQSKLFMHFVTVPAEPPFPEIP
jgi:hypothetical protein